MARASAFVIVLGIAFCWPNQAEACDCGALGICESFWKARVVFAGRVISGGAGGARLQVLDRFRGTIADSEVVVSGPASMCAYPFKADESYLVFATVAASGELEVTLCSRTQPLKTAVRELAYARSARSVRPSDRGGITGTVELPDPWWQPLPLPRQTVVTATSVGGQAFTAAVNNRGEFRFRGLPQGVYRLTASAPGGFQTEIEEVAVNDPRGCDDLMFRLLWGGEVSGVVRDVGGRLVAGVPLQLSALPDDAPNAKWAVRQARSGADGRFSFETVPPGAWRLDLDPSLTDGVTRPIDPSTAKTVSVARAVSVLPNKALTATFTTPGDLTLVAIEGTVVDEEGRLLANATITLGNGIGPIGHPVWTGPDGRFVLAGVAGQKYRVYANHHLPENGPTLESRSIVVPLTAEPGMPAAHIVLRRVF